MPVRTSSKLPSSHPLNIPVITVNSLATYPVKSLMSGSSPMYLSVPQGTDLHGRRFNIHLRGRYTVTTGGTGHTAHIQILGKAGAATLLDIALGIPINQTNEPFAFDLQVRAVYDTAKQLLVPFVAYYFGNGTAQTYNAATVNTALTSIAPADLNFSAQLVTGSGSAPTGTFEVYEFVLT